MTQPNQFDGILNDLKRAPINKRRHACKGGLNLGLREHGAGMNELILFREKMPPSIQEVAVLIDAIRRLYDPAVVVRSNEPAYSHDGRFQSLSIWYWTKPVTLSWHQPVQRELFSATAAVSTSHNYQE